MLVLRFPELWQIRSTASGAATCFLFILLDTLVTSQGNASGTLSAVSAGVSMHSNLCRSQKAWICCRSTYRDDSQSDFLATTRMATLGSQLTQHSSNRKRGWLRRCLCGRLSRHIGTTLGPRGLRSEGRLIRPQEERSGSKSLPDCSFNICIEDPWTSCRASYGFSPEAYATTITLYRSSNAPLDGLRRP
jgi:hypothetical protein